MLTVVSDTHSTEGHALAGRTLDAVREAERVVHAGDFTTVSALDAFHEEAARLDAVHGNADAAAVRERLPAARTLEWEGLRIALTHRRDGGPTGLAMFGRERGADLVISGHSHRPGVTRTDDLLLLNPGSHAQPRGNRPGHAELEATRDGVRGRLRRPDGTVVEEFSL
ncbi:metallophosphoesterase [Halalkalicoccus sp. NIPERK01]|uniref:metallophosphoesterase n=1 Tax=Halalkalicoccus sp. NIPERK01 TaxID=3053469 RepID=UPI00256EF055|nr:metallophosphoesterase [Halalkalicoccus sp. NIPERK01]MDL5362855.1 metallophosphoesterase [Halalkalicoccus sp. NIPERK01]